MILVYLIIAAIFLFAMIILQIVYIKAKLSTFSKDKLESELRLKERVVCPEGNITIYSMIVDIKKTLKANNPVSNQYIGGRSIDTFLPYMCTERETIVNLRTTMKPNFVLCVQQTPNALALQDKIRKEHQVFLMINGSIYLANIIEQAVEDMVVLSLYAVKSPENEILDVTLSGCQMTLVPFLGNLATTVQGPPEQILHSLGMLATHATEVLTVMGFKITTV
jgi:hypothetical protein